MGKFRDLTGQKFGRLTAIKRVEDYIEPSSGRHRARWLCKCDCGNETIVLDGNLIKKNGVKSCGCLRRDFAYNLNKSTNKYDLTGEYGIGYTSKGEEFYFDLEDYELIKDYCWYINNRKYVCSKVDNKQILFHRVVLQVSDEYEVDHKHGKQSRHDNRKFNLRCCAHSDNMKNVGLRINNTSGVTGVNFDKNKQKWIARIVIEGKRTVLGEYDNFDDAKMERLEAEEKYYGEFSYSNSQSYNTK